MEEISQNSVLTALACILLLSMKEPPPGYMSDIQGKINVFIANLHPLILLLGIIKGFSDTTRSALKVPKEQMLGWSTICRFVCGRGGVREGGYHS